ncbi:hypothetical protein C8R45DRAFT_1096211 [Mycena sanguinolenta]|nr:hypothetical protein C8R45DRAFT_1096211 [Mycena sanguinolenta]
MHSKDIERAATTLKKARFTSKAQFEKRFKHRLLKEDYKPGELVLVRSVKLETTYSSTSKTADRYKGPYEVERKNKGGAYVLKELDGTPLKGRAAAAFRLLPYITRDHWFMKTGWMGEDEDEDLSTETSSSSSEDEGFSEREKKIAHQNLHRPMDPAARIRVTTTTTEDIINRSSIASDETVIACAGIAMGTDDVAIEQPSPTLFTIGTAFVLKSLRQAGDTLWAMLCVGPRPRSSNNVVRVATIESSPTPSDCAAMLPPQYELDTVLDIGPNTFKERPTSALHLTRMFRDVSPLRPLPLDPALSLETTKDLRHNNRPVDIQTVFQPWQSHTYMAPIKYDQCVELNSEMRFYDELEGNWTAKGVVWKREGITFVLCEDEERSLRAQVGFPSECVCMGEPNPEVNDTANMFADRRLAQILNGPPPPPPTPELPAMYANGPRLDGLQEMWDV